MKTFFVLTRISKYDSSANSYSKGQIYDSSGRVVSEWRRPQLGGKQMAEQTGYTLICQYLGMEKRSIYELRDKAKVIFHHNENVKYKEL